MAIPTSNKAAKKPSAELATTTSTEVSGDLDAKKEKAYQKLINKFVPKITKSANDTEVVEINKVKLMFALGTDANKLFDGLTNKQRAKVLQRLSAAIGIPDSFIGVCAKFALRYDEVDLHKILEAKLNTRFVWAIVTAETKEDGDHVLKLALEGGMSPDDIRGEINAMKKSRIESSGGATKGPGKGKSLQKVLKRSLTAATTLSEVFKEYYDMEKFYDSDKDAGAVKEVYEQLDKAMKAIEKLAARLDKLVK